MKLAFSTREFNRASFSALCTFASEYGMDGFEIYDAASERRMHRDSILRTDRVSGARTALASSGVCITSVVYPNNLDTEEASDAELIQYIDMASLAGIENVIVHLGKCIDGDRIRALYSGALKRISQTGVFLLFETDGALSCTNELIKILNSLKSAYTAASWNVRSTFFDGGETAETTVKILGSYIRFVRLGDRLDCTNVLCGEGSLPVRDVMNALRSLNYDGFVTADSCDDISDSDIVLTHFASYISQLSGRQTEGRKLYKSRSGKGTFPYKRYEMVDCTLSDVLDDMASIYPDQYAFKYTTLDYTVTYSQFRRDVDRISRSLISIGVKPGSHVAVWAANIPQWFITFWACVRIGAVLVTVNTAYRINELEYLLRQSDTHTLVMTKSYKDMNYEADVRELCPELKGHIASEPLFSERLPFLRYIISVGFEMEGAMSWESLEERSGMVPVTELRRRINAVKPDDVCNMQYTSGTTGFPKGVMLTNRNIVNDGKIIGDRMDLSTADRMMIQVPMFHCFGMVLSMVSSMTHGTTMCPMPYFSPKSSLSCINQERITCFNGVPTMFIAMFNHADFCKTDFSEMRTGIMAGSNCPADLMKRAAAEMNMTQIVSVYGQTEASPGCTMGDVTETLEQRTETVGTSFPGIECRIVDPETGVSVPDGMNGEFVVRGFNVMRGYYKMPEATAKAIDNDGWLHSGDLCCRTPDGYYRVTGRLKDMIIRGGENVYPREIEEFYLTYPKIRDVQVVGVRDAVYGEEACAWIILHDGQNASEKEVRDFGIKHIARHKVPRYFIFTESFPMNAAGKILKYKMKEESERILGL